MADGATTITAVRTVGVPATDQARTHAFYTDVLGFETTLDAPFGGGQRWIEVTPGGGGTSIAITPVGDSPVGVDTGIRLTSEDVEADHARLKSAGVQVDAELLRFPGAPPMFTLLAPDGNRLYVVGRM
jgi:predicted enzyme related to lactoylglutathione lyase